MTSLRFQYRHGGWSSVRRWLFYFLTLNAAFAVPMLLARSTGYAPEDPALVRAGYFAGTLLATLIASGMLYRFTRTSELSLDDGHMVMPHFLWPRVRLEHITAVHVDPRQPGVLLLGVDRQLPRFIRLASLSPATTAEALAERVRTAIAGIDPGKARELENASLVAVRNHRAPWACLCLTSGWLLVHALASHAGSRFDDLDLLASGAYLHSLVLQGDLARVFGATFLHAHIPHLLANVATLLMLGTVLEGTLGWHALLVYYVASATIAVAGAGWLAQGLLHVGASGGLFGLIGVLMYLRVTRPGTLPASIHALPTWLLLVVASLSLGLFVPGVDWRAHGLGLLSGICLSMVASRWRTPCDITSSVDANSDGAQPRASRVLTFIPRALVFGAIGCSALSLVDVSRRVHAIGSPSRLATLNQLATSHPDLDALNAVTWRSVVLDGEFASAAGPLIGAFAMREPLTPEQRDTLAALHLIAGSPSKAAGQQFIALQSATGLPEGSQEAIAVRLAVYVQHLHATRSDAPKLAPGGGDVCAHLVEVTGPQGSPQSLRVRVVPTGHSDAPGDARDRLPNWLAPGDTDCTAPARTWSFKTTAASETQWASRYR